MKQRIPKRLLILQRLCDHMAEMRKTDGYTYNLSHDVVYRGRALLGNESKVNARRPVALSVIESPRPDIAVYAGNFDEARSEKWTLLLQAQVFDELTDTDQAYYLAADLELHLSKLTATRAETGRPLYPDLHNLGGLISGMEIAPPVVRPPEAQVSATSFVFLPVRLSVAGKQSEPYVSL